MELLAARLEPLLKIIEYHRHEFGGDAEQRQAELSVFVYDIPYFGACGIFPPFQIANGMFESGGSSGGMSPGSTWEPFSISEAEYDELVDVLNNLDPENLSSLARYTKVKFQCDPAFDGINDWGEWTQQVCDKHRDSYHDKMGFND